MKEAAIEIFYQRRKWSNGSWSSHSILVANAAYLLAKKMGLDCEKAYAMGLMHDIGRSFSKGQFKHIADGYEYLTKLGYPELARICLTHSFPLKDINTYVGELDIEKPEQEKYQKLLQETEYDDYDKLIQLCDAISMSNRYALVEEKFVKNVLKYGVKESTPDKWKAVFSLFDYFEMKTGMDIKREIIYTNGPA